MYAYHIYGRRYDHGVFIQFSIFRYQKKNLYLPSARSQTGKNTLFLSCILYWINSIGQWVITEKKSRPLSDNTRNPAMCLESPYFQKILTKFGKMWSSCKMLDYKNWSSFQKFQNHFCTSFFKKSFPVTIQRGKDHILE